MYIEGDLLFYDDRVDLGFVQLGFEPDSLYIDAGFGVRLDLLHERHLLLCSLSDGLSLDFRSDGIGLAADVPRSAPDYDRAKYYLQRDYLTALSLQASLDEYDVVVEDGAPTLMVSRAMLFGAALVDVPAMRRARISSVRFGARGEALLW